MKKELREYIDNHEANRRFVTVHTDATLEVVIQGQSGYRICVTYIKLITNGTFRTTMYDGETAIYSQHDVSNVDVSFDLRNEPLILSEGNSLSFANDSLQYVDTWIEYFLID